MKTIFKDPLLAISWVVLTGFLALFALGAGLGFLASFAIPFVPYQVEAVIAPGMPTTIAEASWAIFGMSMFASALIGAFAWFAYLLRRIVLSVAEGDPFALANANRLSAMAWLTVAISGAVPALVAIIHKVSALTGENGIAEEIEFGPNGLFLALILFILARVFRHGAAMREDLEGTV